MFVCYEVLQFVWTDSESEQFQCSDIPLIMSVVHHHIIKHVDRYASIAPPPSLERMLSVEHRYLHACTNSGFHENEVKSTCTEEDEGGVSNTNTFF